MGLFEKLFAAPQIELAAPVAGEAVAITEVADPTFSEEILGKGVAIRPAGNAVFAPCDATVDLAFDTGHAVSMTADNGAEILIHVGLETVNLKGAHFKVHVANGEHVRAGQLLIEFDREAIAAAGYDTITPMVICNSGDFKDVLPVTGKTVKVGEKILGLVK